VQKLFQLFGFSGDDYDNEDDFSEYDERPRSKKKSRRSDARGQMTPPKLVFFKGIPSDEIRLRLRDVLLDGTMILLDLSGMSDRKDEAVEFIHFMTGVAFAHKGDWKQIGPSLFIITPREGMLQWWAADGED